MTLVVETLEFSTFSTIYAITFVCVYELKLSELINTYESLSGGIYNVYSVVDPGIFFRGRRGMN